MTRLRRGLPLAVGAALLASCGGTPVTTTSPTITGAATTLRTPAVATSPSPVPSLPWSASPGPTDAPRGDVATVPIAVGETTRNVLLITPTRLASGGDSATYPLLVLLHGNGSSVSGMSAAADAERFAERERVIVALPPAETRYWFVGLDEPDSPSPDVAYVAGVIEQLLVDFPVDPSRIFLAGFSRGGFLAGRIACERADLVAGSVMVGGGDWGGQCVPSRPVSILVLHGTADTTAPIGGAEAFAAKWRKLDKCSGAPRTSTPLPETSGSTSDRCARGSSVEVIRFEGRGHAWLNGATELVWSFVTGTARGS